MICTWRWFIQPATEINKNRNGWKALGMNRHYRAIELALLL